MEKNPWANNANTSGMSRKSSNLPLRPNRAFLGASGLTVPADKVPLPAFGRSRPLSPPFLGRHGCSAKGKEREKYQQDMMATGFHNEYLFYSFPASDRYPGDFLKYLDHNGKIIFSSP